MMSEDLPTILFKRYGTLVFGAAGIAALVIWSLAHWTAAPGTQVSVLWGFVSYTKSSSVLAGITPLDPTGQPTSNAVATVLPQLKPTVLVVRHHVTTDQLAVTVMKEWRGNGGLRELTVSEAGRRTGDVPEGTYYFVYGRVLRSELRLFDGEKGVREVFVEPFKDATASRFRSLQSEIEVHYPKGHVPLLNVFAAESAVVSITQLSGQAIKEVSVTSVPRDPMTSLVAVPIDRVVRCRSRDAQYSSKEDLVILDCAIH